MRVRSSAFAVPIITALMLSAGCSAEQDSAPESSTPAGSAGDEAVSPIDFTASCSDSGQQCSTHVVVPFEVDQVVDDATAKVRRGPLHCSSVAYTVSIDGGDAVTTEFTSYEGGPTGPPDTVDVDLGTLDPGEHELRISGVGQEGGCNGGTILSFAGSVELPKGARPTDSVSYGPNS